jgi:signal peptidase I
MDFKTNFFKSGNIVFETIKSFVFAIIVCSIIYLFIFTPNQVEGTSMTPNFQDGELVLTNKVSEWLGDTPVGLALGLDYHRGDVVVVLKPNMEKPIIKRIIGLPGDKIEIKENQILINDQVLEESYIPEFTTTTTGTFLRASEFKSIPEHHYAVMGDNRENSLDSRYTDIGFVNRDWIQGKVIFRYWPPSAFGLIGNGTTNLE